MKNYLFSFVLLLSITSCYAPRIVYEIENVQSNIDEDSLEIQLIAGSTRGFAISPYSTFHLEISNETGDNIFMYKKSTLTLEVPSVTLEFENRKDTIYRIDSHKMKKIWLYFRLDDSERLLYKFKMDHRLNLMLHFEDVDGKSITKQILLKPIKTRRLRYEKKYDG